MNISNEMFKEHLMDLSMDKKIAKQFEDLESSEKAKFTKAYNLGHKD